MVYGGINWGQNALKALDQGFIDIDVGGHIFDGALAAIMVFDYLNGYDFANERLRFTGNMVAITRNNIDKFNAIFVRPGLIDFRSLSKVHNLKLLQYNFDLNSIADRVEPAQAALAPAELAWIQQHPVIGISADVADRERAEGFAAACDDFLAKPVVMETLLAGIKEQLRIEWIEEGGEEAAVDVSLHDQGKPAMRPPKDILDAITQKVEWGDYAGLERILAGLEAEDAEYGGFCSRVREYARLYDDEGILEHIRTRSRGTKDEGRGTKDERREDEG